MTDDKKSLDLDTAQRLYIAAGQPEQAEAAGFVIDAVRNTVQGEWGTAFVNSFEGLLKKYIEPLTVEISGLRTEVATRLGKIERDIRALNKRHGTQIKSLAKDIAAIKAIIAARPAQRVADQQRLEARLLSLEERLKRLEARD